jgi:hypothetical protein
MSISHYFKHGSHSEKPKSVIADPPTPAAKPKSGAAAKPKLVEPTVDPAIAELLPLLEEVTRLLRCHPSYDPERTRLVKLLGALKSKLAIFTLK